jgi:hypothetical protein
LVLHVKGKNADWSCLRSGLGENFVQTGRKLYGVGENCTMKGFGICTNLSDQIKMDVMNGARSMHRNEQKRI